EEDGKLRVLKRDAESAQDVEGGVVPEHELRLQERLERHRPPALPPREHVAARVAPAAGMEVGEPAPEVEQTERRRRAVLQVGVEAVGRSGHPEIQLGGGHERPATPDRQVELPAEKGVIRVEVVADAETDGGSRRTDERLPAPGADRK